MSNNALPKDTLNESSYNSAPQDLSPDLALLSHLAPVTSLVPTSLTPANFATMMPSEVVPTKASVRPANSPAAIPIAPLPLRSYNEPESSMLMRLEEIDQLKMEPSY